jgi:hypothetical protein
MMKFNSKQKNSETITAPNSMGTRSIKQTVYGELIPKTQGLEKKSTQSNIKFNPVFRLSLNHKINLGSLF